jgi:formate hydrogenlyase subunit 3/multisubunit Na+/H+ antiporter MnhD subunit
MSLLQCPIYHGVLGPFGWVFMLIGGIVFLVVSVLIANYMHKDAIKRGINAEFWLVFGLFFNVFGLILYLIVRNNYNQARKE